MKVTLPFTFMWLVSTMVAMLLLFHFYLSAGRGVQEVGRGVGRGAGRVKWGELGENTTARGLQYLRKFDTKSSSSVRDGPENTGFRNQTDQDRITWRDKPVASLEKISSKLVTEMEKTSFGNQTDQLEVRWREKHPKTPQPIEEPDKTSFESQTDRFAIHPPFSLPTPRATLPLSELLACPWVGQLKSLLPLLPPSLPISLVSSDHTYREVLLNWLIAAEVKVHPPLSSVLVLSLDVSLHQLLGERGVACVHIPPSCLLAHSLRLQHHVTFSQVHIMRLLVMRLLNHWGWDVANYDSDAIVLKNLEKRFAQFPDKHLIGSVGHFPQQLAVRWGAAVCIGVVLIRAARETELYWEEMSSLQIGRDATNDQGRLNWALVAMNVTRDSSSSTPSFPLLHPFTAHGRDGFKIVVLSVRDVCRQTCTRKQLHMYCVWHKGGKQTQEGKMAYASKGGLWYLREDWERVSLKSKKQGREWLKELSET